MRDQKDSDQGHLLIKPSHLKRWSFYLEAGALALVIAALLYRATVYWTIPVANGDPYGVGDIVDFGFAMVLFLVCAACAATGVLLSFRHDSDDHKLAFRPVLVGILSFGTYFFLHPRVPQLL